MRDELFKNNEFTMKLSIFQLEDLIALYLKAKTGLENPLIELPMCFISTLTDITEWVNNYNKQQTLKEAI
jgi:hypothetical protein